jgi:hypothetical protein
VIPTFSTEPTHPNSYKLTPPHNSILNQEPKGAPQAKTKFSHLLLRVVVFPKEKTNSEEKTNSGFPMAYDQKKKTIL